MNEFNTMTHDLDHLRDVASIDLERLLASPMPRSKLLPLVKARVKLVIAQFAQGAPRSTSTGGAAASAKVVDYLRGAPAIPLQPELCTLMARAGFDKALFTYGHVDGMPMGYAEGAWLLKFVELTEKEPTRHHETSWLRLLSMDAAALLSMGKRAQSA